MSRWVYINISACCCCSNSGADDNVLARRRKSRLGSLNYSTGTWLTAQPITFQQLTVAPPPPPFFPVRRFAYDIRNYETSAALSSGRRTILPFNQSIDTNQLSEFSNSLCSASIIPVSASSRPNSTTSFLVDLLDKSYNKLYNASTRCVFVAGFLVFVDLCCWPTACCRASSGTKSDQIEASAVWFLCKASRNPDDCFGPSARLSVCLSTRCP